MEEKNEEVVAIEGGITIKQVLEKQEFDLKEMIKEIADVPVVYRVRSASSDMIIRRLGYNGFTVIYTISNRDGEISLDSSDETKDHIAFHIERKGEVLPEKAFYDISKQYSQQQIALKTYRLGAL
tara:strand:- start:35 stop:409 length:375 start_codon:yes stop_codon:yes gene_type:complete